MIKNHETKSINDSAIVAVVIPCYRVRAKILGVISAIGKEVNQIFVVDDCCPDKSGLFVQKHNLDPRVVVLTNERNLGVGGAVIAGYKAAITAHAEIIVKIDGDGQMDPGLIPILIDPILNGAADYTKGNRFFYLDQIGSMPKLRIFGNAILSFITKVSSGYWNIFDPTNGFTAIHANVASHIPFEKISQRFFFESDMLFRLNLLRAVVWDIPMDAKYEDEVSNLKVSSVVHEFAVKNIKNLFKRIFYNYFLRDMSLASIELIVGTLFILFGLIFGCYHWSNSALLGVQTPIGTVMLAVLPIMIGIQFILGFIGFDISSIPSKPINILLRPRKINDKHKTH